MGASDCSATKETILSLRPNRLGGCYTNSYEVELDYKMYISPKEYSKLECSFKNGGFVKLHTTQEPKRAKYIPYTNPFVSKLASLAFDVVTSYDCSFIYTSYLEPYGVVGALVSQWTGIPYSVQHAGSDIGNLAQILDRRSTYIQVIQKAELVITRQNLARYFLAAGVNYEKLVVRMPSYFPSEYFNAQGAILDIAELLDEVKNTEYASCLTDQSRFDPSKPTIGVYGKAGKFKGTLERRYIIRS